MSSYIHGYCRPRSEALYESDSFPERELAALVASKVYYHLEEFDDALKYALGAGQRFDVASKSEYVETLIAKSIDEYIALRVKSTKHASAAAAAAAASSAAAAAADDDDDEMDADAPSTSTSSAASASSSSASSAPVVIDARLEAIVERMFDRCFADGEYKQALGVALEARRMDRVRAAIERSANVFGLLAYALDIALTRIAQREFRHEVLRLLVDVYTQQVSLCVSVLVFMRVCLELGLDLRVRLRLHGGFARFASMSCLQSHPFPIVARAPWSLDSLVIVSEFPLD